MSLTGELSVFSLTDLLQWLASSQQTGRVDFHCGSVMRELYLRDGVIVAANSNQPTEMLGHALVARGKLSEEQLRAGLMAHKESGGGYFGQVLLRLGFVSDEDLLRALAEKTEEIVFGLFEWDGGVFDFKQGAQPDESALMISLKVDHVLLRGVHRHDEMARIRKVFPDGRVVLGKTDAEPPREITEHPLARRILEAMDGRRTIDELAMFVHAGPFPVKKFLYEGFRLGLFQIVSLEGPSLAVVTGDAPDAELAALSGTARIATAAERLEGGDPEAALALLDDEAVQQNDRSRALRKAAEEAFLEKVYAEEFSDTAVPRLATPLEDLVGEALRPEEYFLLSRLDGTWSVRDVVDIAPMREVETVRVLRRLIRRGLVRAPVQQPA